MTRAERIKIRAERVRLRNEKSKAKQTEKTEVTTTTTTIIEVPKDKLSIELVIHCFKYQKRLTWMLSSILQQQGNDLPDLIINISHCDNDGIPTTEEVCKLFRDKGLNIKETLVADNEVHNRGRARNKQTQECQADYILYLDCDMAFDVDFFEDLHKQLKTNLKDETRLMGADRISLSPEYCVDYFEKEDKHIYPCVIENVADLLKTWKVWRVTGRGTAPGNFQLCSMKAIKAKGCKYGGRNRDFWRNTKSDRAMRCRMGRTPIIVKKQWHLNHGREMGIQR